MSVDLAQQARIQQIDTDLLEANRTVKTLVEAREALLADVPEYQTLLDAERAVEEAKERLKLATRDMTDLAKIEVDLAEARFDQRDLREQYSHHLIAYIQETGREVVRDRDGVNHAIELRAKKGKPALDQPRLPLGINKHLGQRQPIPEGMRIEREPQTKQERR